MKHCLETSRIKFRWNPNKPLLRSPYQPPCKMLLDNRPFELHHFFWVKLWSGSLTLDDRINTSYRTRYLLQCLVAVIDIGTRRLLLHHGCCARVLSLLISNHVLIILEQNVVLNFSVLFVKPHTFQFLITNYLTNHMEFGIWPRGARTHYQVGNHKRIDV